MDANKIQVVDDEGNELDFEVLFTFESEENGKKYVLYYDAEDENPQVYSSVYDDEGNLFPVETPDEWEMIEEVFNSFVAQDEDDEDEDEAEEEHVCCHKGDENHECHKHDEDHVCHKDDEDHECCCHKNEG